MAPRQVAHDDRPLTDAEMGIQAAPSGDDRPLTDAEMGIQEAPGVGESLLRGAAQGATLGFADEATGALEAIKDKLMGAHEALGELYLKHRDESRKNYHAAEQANSGVYTAGQIGGGLATAAFTGGGGIALQAGKMAAVGAAQGLGSSEAETGRELVADTAISGLVGGAAGAGGALLGRAAGAVMNKAAPAIQEASDTYTLKAAGAMKGDLKGLGKEAIAERAATTREFVSPLSSVGKVADRVEGALDVESQRIGNSLAGLDEKVAAQGFVGGSNMSGHSLADKLEQDVLRPLLKNPNRSMQAEGHARNLIEQYRGMGDAPLSFNEANDILKGAQQGGKIGLAGAIEEGLAPGVNQVRAEASKSIRRELINQANAVSPELAGIRDQAGKRMADLYPIAETARDRATGLSMQSQFGVSGLAAGAIGMATGHGVVGTVAALGQKAIRQNANSLAATGFQRLAQAARTSPQSLGKWGSYLAAAAARGDAALATTHYTLSQNDKEYAAAARLLLDQKDQ